MRVAHWVLGLVVGATLIHCGPPSGGSTDGGSDGGTMIDGGSDGGTSVGTRVITLVGQVRDHSGYWDAPPVEGATIRAGESYTRSGSGGFFRLEATVADQPFVVVHFEHKDYATGHVRLALRAATEYSVDGQLLPYRTIRTKRFNSAQTFTLPDVNGFANDALIVEIPSGALDPTREFTVSLAYGDPSDARGRAVFPGEFVGSSAGAGETAIESVAFTAIDVHDDAGKPVHKLNAPATVTLRLPDVYQVGGAMEGTYDTATNNTIPWWSFDESTGRWVREDADPSTPAIDDVKVIDIGGTLYVQARVLHFSWWNWDKPIETQACLCAKVVSHDGTPVVDGLVEAHATTYTGYVSTGLTNSQGQACMVVQRSSNGSHRSTIRVRRGAVTFQYDVTDPSEGDVALDTVTHPLTQGSASDPSTCKHLAHDLVLDFAGTVTGTVTSERTGTPIADYTVFTNLGTMTRTNANGQYSLRGPIALGFTVGADRTSLANVYIPDVNTPQVANLVVLDQSPVIADVHRSISGPIQNGATVTLTAVAHDPDGAPLTYAWTLESGSQGSLGAAAGTTTSWTAPASGSGVDFVTLTVDDGFSAPTSFQVALRWGAENFNTRFSVTVQDPHTLQPLSGVGVVVHRPNGTTIQASAVTDATGFVDFGDLGRNRISVTVIYPPYPNKNGAAIYTFDDVPARENGIVRLDGPGPNIQCSVYDYSATSVETNIVRFAPINYSWYSAVGGSVTTSIYTCSDNLHPDGTISLLGISYDNLDAVSEFGAALNQDPAAAAPVVLNTAPLAIGVTTNVNAWTSVMMVRNGVSYDLYHDAPGTLVTRYLPPTSLFPVDTYGFHAVTAGVSPVARAQRYFTSPPASVTMTLPSFDLTALTYQPARAAIGWAYTGTSPRDFVRLNLDISQVNRGPLTWTVLTPANRTEWTFPDLPPEFAHLFDPGTADVGDNSLGVRPDVCDYAPYNSLDEYWIRILTGYDTKSVGIGVDNSAVQLNTTYFGLPPA